MLAAGIFGFSRAAAAERLLDAARPTVGEEGIVEMRSNLDVMARGFDEIIGGAFPAVAGELELSDAELQELLRQNYPEIGALIDRREEIQGAFEKTVSNLEAHQGDFEAADDLPAPGVPMTAVPIALLGTAVVLGAAGVFAWRNQRATPLWVIAGVGVALVAGTFALGIPSKSAQASDLLDSLTFSEESASATREQFEVAEGFVTGVLTGFLPDVATELGTTTDELVADLGRRFPALGPAVPRIERALARIELDVQLREERVDDGRSVKQVPLRALPWLVVAIGVVLVAVATPALVATRRRGPGGTSDAGHDAGA